MLLAALAFALASPAMLRDARRRRISGGGGSLSGIGAGLDVVWRPSAAEAHADWEATVELPAPAPTPGDRALESGRMRIELQGERTPND